MGNNSSNATVKAVMLDNTCIQVNHYESERVNGFHQISISFNVKSEEYHAIATLLYKGEFDVKVPEQNLAFRGRINQYSTSITNLYDKDRTGEYKVRLLEIQN